MFFLRGKKIFVYPQNKRRTAFNTHVKNELFSKSVVRNTSTLFNIHMTSCSLTDTRAAYHPTILYNLRSALKNLQLILWIRFTRCTLTRKTTCTYERCSNHTITEKNVIWKTKTASTHQGFNFSQPSTVSVAHST